MSKFNEARSLTEYAQILEDNAHKGNNAKLVFYRSWYMDEFGFPEGARVLDAGGYVGASAIEWAKRGHMVTSIEGSKTYCAEFRENVSKQAQEIQDRIRLVEGLIEDFDEPEAYGVAVCTETWSHFLKPERVMDVLYASLKPGGLLFVAHPVKAMRQDRQHINASELYGLMVGAGFAAEMREWSDGVHVSQNLGFGVKHE